MVWGEESVECERKQKNDGGGTTSGKPMLDAGSKKKQRARRCRGSLFTRGGKEHHAKPSRARMIEIGTASLLGCAPRKDREKKRERETLEKREEKRAPSIHRPGARQAEQLNLFSASSTPTSLFSPQNKKKHHHHHRNLSSQARSTTEGATP